MRCPYCHQPSTRVTDKRGKDNLETIRRRRECLNCKKRFTTYERLETTNLFIIKKDGRREPFNKEKIKTGIIKACQKRPISSEHIENAINDIETKLKSYKKDEINSKIIGELIMDKLKLLDKIAYIRFASVYRDFQDVDDFKKAMKEIKK